MRIFVIGLGTLLAARGMAEPPSMAPSEPSRKSRVVLVQNEQAVRLFEAEPKTVRAMLERGIRALTSESDVGAAWRHYVQPGDVVGIKIATHAGPLLATHHPLVETILSGLEQAGIPPENIIIWDRFASEMKASGYILVDQPGAVKYLATTPEAGSDENVFYKSGLVGKPLWGDFDVRRVTISDRSYFSRIVTQRITKLINVPVLTDHRDAGLSGCLFNLAIGSTDNTRRFAASPWFYDPAVAEICAMEPLRSKTVLHILDALVAQYAGGPNVQPRFAWHFGALYLSTDPVAIDTLALADIEAQRAAHGLQAIRTRARHIASAAELELGTNRREEIELLKLP